MTPLDHAALIATHLGGGFVGISIRNYIEPKGRPADCPCCHFKVARLKKLCEARVGMGEHEVVCQVLGEEEAKGPRRAWLSIQAWGYRGDRDLVAYLEGDQVMEIGRCLHQLCMEVMHPDQVDGLRSIFAREVMGFFLFGDGEEDIWNLETVDPEHP